MSQALAQIAESSRYSDLFEIRLDRIVNPQLDAFAASSRKPLIATSRLESEGGQFHGSERKRIELLEAAASKGFGYIDLELQTAREVLPRFRKHHRRPALIVSHHLFGGKEFSPSRVYDQLSRSGGDVVKLAYLAKDSAEILPAVEFLSLARADRRRAVAIAMGTYGEPTRVLYKKFGAWATYAAPEDGSESAPGQLRASELKNVFRADRLSARTKVYGVVGNPLAQSKGVFIHNRLFKGPHAVYCRFLVQDLKRFMAEVVPFVSGFSVTLPFKEEIIQFLDRVDPVAGPIRAVNTVVRKRGVLWGTNSDATGALDAIERALRVRQKTVAVIGAGGAARAIAYEAKRRGAHVIVTNRTEDRARSLAQEFGLRHVSLQDLQTLPFDVLVNATSVGMFPRDDKTPAPPELGAGKVVFDAVYNPPNTRFLREARALGARTISGTEMYINQAAEQSRLFTGRTPDRAAMRRILGKALYQSR